MDKLMPYNFHTLQLRGGRFLEAAGFGPADHPRVLSSHHQALGKVAAGWKVLATSRDGKVVEAMEHKRFTNVLGVQFHPEHAQLWETEPRFRQRPEDPLTSYNAILAGTPRSLEFNKAVWAWLGARLRM
jgi:putative glutamine amidotransferase